MTNKSGTGSNVISLPKGGGAISGLGEKFSADLFTGTGNFSVPIAVHPGRNGFQPELSLGFSTGGGNGIFGIGWGLSVPGVYICSLFLCKLWSASLRVFQGEVLQLLHQVFSVV